MRRCGSNIKFFNSIKSNLITKLLSFLYTLRERTFQLEFLEFLFGKKCSYYKLLSCHIKNSCV